MTDFSHFPPVGSQKAGDAPSPGAARSGTPAQPGRDPTLWSAAQSLEANFLAEMLKAAGLGESRDIFGSDSGGDFGGGIGEDQFASFLRQAQADEMARAGGIGLAESLYQALKEKQDEP